MPRRSKRSKTAEEEPAAEEGAEDVKVPALPPLGSDKKEDDAVDAGAEPAAKKVKVDEDAALEKEDDAASPADGILGAAAPPATLANDFRGGQESWNAMLYQLLLYKAQRGDLNVPPNDTAYRLLHNWVQTQRKHYALYQENKTSSTFLNADRIAVLDAIDFEWHQKGDTVWTKNYDALVAYKAEHGDARVPRVYAKNPKLGEWVIEQRRQWRAKQDGKPNILTDDRKKKLDEVGMVWKVRDRADWNDRYEQLLEFKKENGHCIVPQHYTRNRALGKWVAKQREQYRFFREGKHSFLTEERIDLLKSVSFVWQIKGRGLKKKALAAAAAAGTDAAAAKGPFLDEPLKSLAKVEEEEVQEQAKKGGPKKPAAAKVAAATAAEEALLAKKDGDAKPPALPAPANPAIGAQAQLLQANMAAIAAHASGNPDLAAALRLGRAAQLGEPKGAAETITKMI